MANGRTYIVTAIMLLALASIPSHIIVDTLTHEISQERTAYLYSGIQVLKTLFSLDIIILLSIILFIHKGNTYHSNSEYLSFWCPTRIEILDNTNTTYYRLAIPILLLAALLLRLPNLNSDLWIDEVFTVVNFVRLPLGQIITDFSSDNQHIFFSFLSHITVSIFGEQAWAVRLPSLLFGLASIWASMALAKLVYGRRVAILTGLLLALSYHHIWFSQNARGYAILFFGTVYSTFLILRALETGKLRYWVIYAIVIAFSSWAHITAVFVSVAHGLIVLPLLIKNASQWKQVLPPLIGFFLAAWFTLHLYALTLPQMIDFFMQPGAGTGTIKTEWRSPVWLLTETFRSLGIGNTIGWIGISIFLTFSGFALYWYIRHDWVFVGLALLPGLLLGTTMFALGRNLWPRMFFNEIGFVIIFIAAAVVFTGYRFSTRFSPKIPLASGNLLAAVVAIVFASGLPDLYRYPKQDFTGARDYVLHNKNALDSVIGLHMAGRMYRLYYARNWPEVNSYEDLLKHESTNGYTWIIYTLPKHIEQVMPAIFQSLKKDYKIVKVFRGTLGDGNVIVCRSIKKGGG